MTRIEIGPRGAKAHAEQPRPGLYWCRRCRQSRVVESEDGVATVSCDSPARRPCRLRPLAPFRRDLAR